MAKVFILGKYLVLIIRMGLGVIKNWVRIQKEESKNPHKIKQGVRADTVNCLYDTTCSPLLPQVYGDRHHQSIKRHLPPEPRCGLRIRFNTTILHVSSVSKERISLSFISAFFIRSIHVSTLPVIGRECVPDFFCKVKEVLQLQD